MDLNKVMLIGRLSQDPEIRTTPSGLQVARFGLATGRVWKDQQGQKQEKTEFHNIIAWRRLAEICGEYLHKGSKIYIEGHLETSSWQDQSGVKKYRTEVITENMIMLDRKGDNVSRGSDMPLPQEPPMSVSSAAESAEEEINVEDIPF